MSISSIVTRGFGSYGSIALIITRGYNIGEAPVPPIVSGSVSMKLNARTNFNTMGNFNFFERLFQCFRQIRSA